jgi:hypothetical protein
MFLLGAALGAVLATSSAKGAVSADEAAQLKTTLTPTGAERAGNKDGSIPAWDGGLTRPLVPTTGRFPADQFPGEKPLYVVNAQNYKQYADHLSEGEVALLMKYPETFHLSIYPTHRTYVAPQSFYDGTFANATRAQVIDNGMSISGAYDGVPFPIPKSGIEIYWNHTLRSRPLSQAYQVINYTGNADGSLTMTVQAIDNRQGPYFDPDGNLASWNGEYGYGRLQMVGPAFKAGEALVIRDGVNPNAPRQAWQYLVGQRRVRRAPTVAYDTPDFVASGANYFDEVFGFWGAPDRYEWKLVGKKEIYIPYNENGFFQVPIEQATAAHHLNPDRLRFELHRVWVVDATLAPGKRHVVPKRRFYFDEDSWSVALLDGYDADGKLWRTSQLLPIVIPEAQSVFHNSTVIYNLQAGTFSCVEFYNGGFYKDLPKRPDSFFTGDAVAADAVR